MSGDKPDADVLTYFAHRGRADLPQLLYALAGAPLTLRRVEWAHFVEQRERGAYPSGQLPVLAVKKKGVLTQSRAIARYAAKLADLYPADALDAARTDAVVDRLADINATAWYLAPEAKRAEALEALLGRLKPVIADLKALLRDNSLAGGTSPWLVGQECTWADVAAFAAIREVSTIEVTTTSELAGVDALLEPLPELMAMCMNVETLEPVQAVLRDDWKELTHFEPNWPQA